MIKSIPVTLLTGFLGSGKTTYLNSMIKKGIPSGSLIIVNDFGHINIDADLIQYRNEQIIRFNNGCICCTLGGSLAEKFASILREPILPTSIYIEASGIANPKSIIDLININSKLMIHQVICLIDASQAEQNSQDLQVRQVWLEQIQMATHIVLNRTINKTIPPILNNLINSNKIKIELSTENIIEQNKNQNFLIKPTNIQGWQTYTFNQIKPIDSAKLNKILIEYQDIIYRVKGFLQCQGQAQMNLIQFSKGNLHWTPTNKKPYLSNVVCIGIKSNRFYDFINELEKLNSYP